MAEKDDMIRMLNDDLTGEIEAILVYMEAHFLMEDKHCPTSLAMLEIAMDEMRHVQWLAEEIAEMDADPELTPRKLRFAGRDLEAALERAVGLETGAIAQYEAHIAAISDAGVRRMLAHIRDEEEDHHKQFVGLLAKVREAAADR